MLLGCALFLMAVAFDAALVFVSVVVLFPDSVIGWIIGLGLAALFLVSMLERPWL
jgi:hypothetical protein